MSQPIDRNLEQLARLLDGRQRRVLQPEDEQRAAVLVPLYQNNNGLGLVLTRRTASLGRHAGEVSFPGGLPDTPGEDPVQTALREAREEVGLNPDHAQVLGQLDDGSTTTGYVITPVVAHIPHPYAFRASPVEVAEILSLPLADFRDPSVFEMRTMQKRGRSYDVPFYELQPATVWGATARIIRHLLQLLDGDRDDTQREPLALS